MRHYRVPPLEFMISSSISFLLSFKNVSGPADKSQRQKKVENLQISLIPAVILYKRSRSALKHIHILDNSSDFWGFYYYSYYMQFAIFHVSVFAFCFFFNIDCRSQRDQAGFLNIKKKNNKQWCTHSTVLAMHHVADINHSD